MLLLLGVDVGGGGGANGECDVVEKGVVCGVGGGFMCELVEEDRW